MFGEQTFAQLKTGFTLLSLVSGRGKIIYLSLHRHHQNDSCIKMCSDESHFNVSLIVRDKVTRQSTDHNF